MSERREAKCLKYKRSANSNQVNCSCKFFGRGEGEGRCGMELTAVYNAVVLIGIVG